MSIKEYLLQILRSSKTKAAIDKLLLFTKKTEQDDLNSSISLLSARYYRNEDMFRDGIISSERYSLELNRINVALRSYINDELVDGEDESITSVTGKDLNPNPEKSSIPNIFLSYSHDDTLIAEKVRAKLEENDIHVVWDIESAEISQKIKSFIEDSIRENPVIISLVSKSSLLSSWVAMESTDALSAEKYAGKKFIAAIIDKSINRRSFIREHLPKIEDNIEDINKEIEFRRNKSLNIIDLQDDLERYINLKNNLPAIMQRLKENISVDITSDNFDNGMERIIKSIIKG